MEPGTGLTILGTAIGSAKLIEKILGPTAEYIGEGLKEWTQKRVENVVRIFSKAKDKLGDKLDSPGAVPPKVLKKILDDGSFCNDELCAEYFGGVLASSRTERSRDDRGVTYINLLSGLSTYQIRTHYIFYTSLLRAFRPLNLIIYPGIDRDFMYIYIPTSIYYSVMELDLEFPSDDDKINILAHAMNGLKRADLIANFTYGNKDIFLQDKIKYRFPEFPVKEEQLAEHGITFKPTPGGMELYIWAHGLGHFTHFQFLDNKLQFDPIPDIKLPDKVVILYEEFIENDLRAMREKR